MWTLGTAGQYTIDTVEHEFNGSLAIDTNINITINSLTNDQGYRVSILTLPSLVAHELNNTDIACATKGKHSLKASGKQILRIKVFGEFDNQLYKLSLSE